MKDFLLHFPRCPHDSDVHCESRTW